MHKRKDSKTVQSIFLNKQRNYKHYKVAEIVELELRIPRLKILYGNSFVRKLCQFNLYRKLLIKIVS